MDIMISDLKKVVNKYDKCRGLANYFGKVIILKDEQPDSVLLPIDEYEKLCQSFKKSDNFNEPKIVDLVKRFPSAGNREVYTLDQLKQDLFLSNESVCKSKNK